MPWFGSPTIAGWRPPNSINRVIKMPASNRSYILHPQGESFGPFDLDFVRLKLAEGAIAPSTGVTVLVDGIEKRYTDVATLLGDEPDTA